MILHIKRNLFMDCCIVSVVMWLALGILHVSHAQETSSPPAVDIQSVDFGAREQGRTYPLTLTAENVNCNAPQDFRFDLSGASWISAEQETVVRNVPKGGAKSISAMMDFRSEVPGTVSGEVRVVCETCGYIPLIKNCRINDRLLVLQAQVIPSTTAQDEALWPPSDPGPLPQSDPLMGDIGRIVMPERVAIEQAIAAGKGPCDELIRQVTSLRSKQVDCSKAEAEVAAARAALATAESELDSERMRRENLRADARDHVSRYQRANAAADAAAAHWQRSEGSTWPSTCST